MSTINEMLVEGSSKINPDKLNKLRRAQEIFAGLRFYAALSRLLI